MDGTAAMDSNNLNKVLTITIASFIQDRLVNREQRVQHKEQCAERLAAGEPGLGEVAYSEQAVLANLDWGIDALEEAISTSHEETKAARLQHAEKMLQVCAMLDARHTTAGVPNFYLCAWSHLNLAYLWKLRNDDRNAVAQILEMFLVDPLFSRIDFAPELWESLFLPHLRSIVGWYTEERHRIVLNHLPDSTDLSFPRDEHQCVFNETLQSGLSLEQTQRLQELEKVYQESLDENTKLYARYYKDWINFDPSVSKKGTKPLIPIAEPPMTPRHELSRLIPQSVKFGPAPPKSAGFYSVVGLSTGNAEAPTRYSSENSNTTDDEADGLSTRRPLNEVNWEEGRTKNYSTDNMYNGDFEMDYEMDTAKKAPAACHRTLENSKQVFSMHQTISEDKFMVANANFPARQNSNSQTASLQLSNKKRVSKSKPLSELLEADTDTAFCSSPKNAYSSEDSVSTSPDAELYLEDAKSYGNIRDDEDEGETESNDNRTHRAALEKKSYSMPISSPLAESEEDISQSSFHVHSSGKSTPQRRPPKDFVCPITGQLFRDPVTLETGQTYERQAIQEWLDRGNTTCPITRQTLGSTALPNKNILLKRLIGSWKEQNPELAMEFRFSETPRPHISNSCDLYSSGLSSWGLISSPTLNPHGDITEVKTKRSFICRSGPVSSSPTSVVSQATLEIMTSELRPSISHLCTSQDLQECESAVLKISKVLQDCKESPIIQSHLAKPAVINSFIEILSNSFDAQALKATVYILSELVSAEDIVAQTLMRVDPDFESLAALLRKGLVEAAVLLYQLKPSSSQLSFHGLVPSLVHIIITKIEENEIQLPLYFQPKEAAIVMLERMLSGGDESCRLLNALTVISMKALPALIESLECKSLQVRFCAVSILLCCIRGDGSCRNLIAHRAELAPVLELFHTGNDGERSISISFISELVRLNRRTFNNQALQIIKDEGTFSTMHMLLVYLQMAPLEQRLIVASLLLQLDLLAEPRKMSMYREEAIETLVEALKAKEFLISQITAAETIVALSGRLSICGKSLTEAWLLRTAGFKKNYNALIKSEKPLSQEVESPEFMEEEEAAKDWERKVAFVLINYEFGALFEALGKCLRNNSLELARPCLVAATWLTYMLKVLPDTGVQDVARRCLLQQFVTVLQSSRILEERILAMLALTSFINDSGALKDLGTYIKGIYKPLRLLKKSSTAAADILRALVNLPSVNVSKLYSFAESAIAHSRMNGEICSLVHCGGRIISGHSDGTLKVWDGRKRMLQLIQDVREHTRSITSISVSSSREKLYSGSLDKSVRVWAIGLQEIQCIQVLDMRDPVQALVVSSSVACFIAQGTGVKIHNWNGTLKLLNPNKNMKCLAMGDGKVYCGCTDYSLQEMDLTSGTTSTLHSGARTLLAQKPIYGLQLHDNHLYACGVFVDGVAAKVWNLSTNNVVGSLSTTADIRCIAVNSDFIFLGSKAGIIEVWLRERLVRVGSLNSEGGNNNRVVCLAVDKERDVVFSGYKDGKIQAWSLS